MEPLRKPAEGNTMVLVARHSGNYRAIPRDPQEKQIDSMPVPSQMQTPAIQGHQPCLPAAVPGPKLRHSVSQCMVSSEHVLCRKSRHETSSTGEATLAEEHPGR